jgi:large conductance mechanosensitive channel
MFINTVIELLIIAFCLFLVIKQVNRFKKAAPPTGPSTEEKLLTEIRDLLKPVRRLIALASRLKRVLVVR